MTTEQVKRATQQMFDAGFTRDQFSVNVERIYNDEFRRKGFKNPYTYGAAQVTVKYNAAALIEARKEALLSVGLGVDKIIFKNGYIVWLIRTESSFSGKYREITVSK